jgi:hypothetical protein
MMLLWKRITKEGEKRIKISGFPISLSRCPSRLEVTDDDLGDEPAHDRLVAMLPTTTQTIYLFPNIRGDLKAYARCAEVMDKDVKNKSIVYIFSPFFFGRTVDENQLLFADILDRKLRLGQTVFVLCAFTASNIIRGCMLDPLYKTGNTSLEEPLLNFLEPSMVLLPYNNTTYTDVSVSPSTTQTRKAGLLFSAGTPNNLLPLPSDTLL